MWRCSGHVQHGDGDGQRQEDRRSHRHQQQDRSCGFRGSPRQQDALLQFGRRRTPQSSRRLPLKKEERLRETAYISSASDTEYRESLRIPRINLTSLIISGSRTSTSAASSPRAANIAKYVRFNGERSSGGFPLDTYPTPATVFTGESNDPASSRMVSRTAAECFCPSAEIRWLT